MLRVKLVALDLDGTLLERDGTILPELRDALIQLSEKGVKVTTASSRFLESQLEFLEPMGLGAKVEVPHALITNDRSGRLVQVLLPFAGKGETVKVLAEYWNIEFSKVLCIDDSFHDMDMLDGRYGFIPATVSNADEEIVEVVRRVGGYVSPFPHGRGVLDVLKHFKLIE